MERLKGIRVLTDRDTFTVMEVVTDKKVHTVRLPYTVLKEKVQGTSLQIRQYNISVSDYCRIKGISTREYFYGSNQTTLCSTDS